MSTIAVKKIKLGDHADTSKNFLIEVPAVADGTLTIKRENGAAVLSIAADGTPDLVVPRKTWTPVLSGGTTAGVGTYTVQTGDYWDYGSMVFFRIALTWTNHTGTGAMHISTPVPLNAQVLNAINTYSSTVNVGANHTPLAVVIGQSAIQMYGINTASGAGASVPAMDTTGELRLSGWAPKL